MRQSKLCWKYLMAAFFGSLCVWCFSLLLWLVFS